jgi:hypothetical protein
MLMLHSKKISVEHLQSTNAAKVAEKQEQQGSDIPCSLAIPLIAFGR